MRAIRARLGVCVLGVLCGAAVLTGGCGYTLAGRGSFLPAYIQTIGIPTFTNSTTVFNVETLLTDKVRAEFIGRGKYKVLPTATDVDATLIGAVSSIAITPASFAPNQLASRYVITMSASIKLQDNHENKIIWENPSLIFRQDYESAPTAATGAVDPNAFFGQQANALDRVSTDFARTIVSAILEAF